MKMVKNAAGRMVPAEINGEKVIPYKGIGKHRPQGKKHGTTLVSAADYPRDGDKCVDSLRDALIKAGLSDGMTISTHHHLRDGDLVANRVFDIAADLGVKDLIWFPSASFPCHKDVIKHLESGVVHHIEGSMNGPLGRFTSEGKMKGTAVLRSHGGRFQAIQDGEVEIDIAVLAAPTADPFGNGHGLDGPSACGGLGYALADYRYAEKVIVVTDNLIPFPCIPMQIEGNYVDFVVKAERIGIQERIVSGTTRIAEKSVPPAHCRTHREIL
ncbi:MAG: citrate lyase subunit alpha [Candidatus Marinimicrobia bacterium]|nr:citrate lyase subunit alpha [Candidatus Neomarinimicrobiota bacterium]